MLSILILIHLRRINGLISFFFLTLQASICTDKYLEFLKWTKPPVSAFPSCSYISIFFLFAPSSAHIQNSNHQIFSNIFISFRFDHNFAGTTVSVTLPPFYHVSCILSLFSKCTSKPPCQNQGKPITLWSHYYFDSGWAQCKWGRRVGGKGGIWSSFPQMIAASDSLPIKANFQIVWALIQ